MELAGPVSRPGLPFCSEAANSLCKKLEIPFPSSARILDRTARV